MKCVSSILIAFTLAALSTVSFAGGVPSSYAPSGHQHHSGHQGGHSQGGRGSSHKVGHSKNPRTADYHTRNPRRSN
jgi:Spy/CpxP family protein refolding chaperone